MTMKTNIKRNAAGNICWFTSTFTPEDYIAHMREFGHALNFAYAIFANLDAVSNDPDGIIRDSAIDTFIANPEGYLTKAGKQRAHSAANIARNAIAVAATGKGI